MNRKVLIFGVSGLTGYKLANIASLQHDVYGTFNDRPTKINNCVTRKINISDKEQVNRIFSDIKPDIVINTTALHNVDFCEENPNLSNLINKNAIVTLFENCQRIGSKLVHISTDYVFDGKKTTPYQESDEANPISVYGRSKLDGEKILADSKNIIVRPSVVYGWTPLELAGITSSSGKPMNFAMWLLTKLHKKEQLKIVADQFASATLADSLAEACLKMALSDKSGLYHVSGLSCESRYEFAVKLAEKFGYDSSSISKTDSSSFVQKAKRPTYSCLNCQKAIENFGLNLLTTEQALDIMREQVKSEANHFIQN